MGIALTICTQATAMATVLFLFRFLFGHRLPRWIFSALWMLVVIRLVSPFEFPPFIFVDVQRFADPVFRLLFANAPGTELSADVDSMWVASAVEPTVHIIWVFGMSVSFTVLLFLYVAQWAFFRQANPVDRRLIWGLNLSSYWPSRSVCFLESGLARTPSVRGFITPSIVFPTGFLNGDKIVVKMILEHELAHVRRFDNLTRLIFLLILCVYWFNPILWFAWRAMCTDQELACDEFVLRGLGDADREKYANALLDAASSMTSLRAGSADFFQQPLRKRIIAIVFPERHLPFWAGTLVTLLVIMTVGIVGYIQFSFFEHHVEMGACSIDLPDYWRGRVDVSYGNDSAVVFPDSRPDLPLIELVIADENKETRVTTPSYVLLWSAGGLPGERYELWGLCYAGMSVEDAWRNGPSSNPVYPGERFEGEAIDLSTGGSVSVGQVRASRAVDPAWFDFYCGELVSGVSLSEE